MSDRSRNLEGCACAPDEIVIGCSLSLPDLSVAEILSGVGFDFLMDRRRARRVQPRGSLQTAFAGLSRQQTTVPIVRVPWNDAVRIKQVLDIGAEGIMLPQIGTQPRRDAWRWRRASIRHRAAASLRPAAGRRIGAATSTPT